MSAQNVQMSKPLYILLHIPLCLIAYFCFMAAFFTTYISPVTMERVTYAHAHLVLKVLIVSSTGSGLLLTRSHFRFVWCLLANVLSPYGFYLLLMEFPRLLYSELFILPALLLAFHLIHRLVLMVYVPARRNKRCRTSLSLRLACFTRYSYIIVSSVLCFIVICAGTISAIGSAHKMDLIRNQDIVYPSPLPLECAAQLKDIAAWPQLDVSGRLAALQAAADIEADYLGLEFIPTVETEPLRPGSNGFYQPSKHFIVISQALIEGSSPKDALITLLHEARHSYQHDMCQLYLDASPEQRNLLPLRQAGAVFREFENYTQPTSMETFDVYRNQVCETDARQYAEERFLQYAFLFNSSVE